MDFLWLFILILLGAIILLNVMTTNIINSSQLHNAASKRRLLLTVWALPIIGVFVAIQRINKDIKLSKKRMEEDIAPAIRELADRLKGLEADFNLKKASRQGSKKLH